MKMSEVRERRPEVTGAKSLGRNLRKKRRLRIGLVREKVGSLGNAAVPVKGSRASVSSVAGGATGMPSRRLPKGPPPPRASKAAKP